MPIDNNEYVVTNIRQIGKDELSICFWLNKDHTFVLDTAGHIFSDKKQTPKNILDSMNDIKNQIHIKDWLSKLSVYKEE